MLKSLVFACLLALPFSTAHAADANPRKGHALGVHDRAIVLDTHLDTPMLFARPDFDIMQRHTVADDFSYVDHPRMIEGGLDGGFFVIYTEQGPRDLAGKRASRDAGLVRLVEIREMIAAHREHFELALTADDVEHIAAKRKRIALISMENASPLALDPSLLDTYYSLGLRMLGLVHSANNDFADSATDKPEFDGLSEKGRALVREANRLGLIVDLSHSSNATVDDVLELSTAPIVLSHSSSFALNPHPRNIDDERLRKIAAKGGVIQVNAVSSFLIDTPKNAERDKAMDAFYVGIEDGAHLTPEKRKQLMADLAAIDKRYPLPQATFEDYMKHMLHIIQVAGIEHVGIGADWDGGGGVQGMEDISALPRITERLLREGFKEKEVEGVLGGNVLRVMREVERLKAH